jgi:hypothetical protein
MFKANDSKVRLLQSLISDETSRIKKATSIIQMTKETEKKINNTKKIIRDKKRTCTGEFPLSVFYDICRTLNLNPDGRFPSDLNEAEVEYKEVEAKNVYAQTELQQMLSQDQKSLNRHQKILNCANAKPGTIDYEVHAVLQKYSRLNIDVTNDEAIGIALANIFQRTGNINEVERIATRGQFALKETGNCAVDVVFDPELRERMAKKYKQLQGWGSLKLMREYSRIADQGDEYSSVKAYIMAASQLKDLPEYILYGV